MKNETARREIESLDYYLQNHTNDYSEKSHTAMMMAIEALQRDTPKNPVVNYVADSDGARLLEEVWAEDSLLCPVCHTYFGEVFDEGYCRKCGQKLIQKRVRVIEK